MSYLGVPLIVLLTALAEADHRPDKPDGPVTLLSGLGDHRHPVSTRNAEAQKFFDQGLILLYAFNHEEAARSFARAAELDPDLAMAYWGLALVRGPNYNLDADDKQWQAAYEVLQKALKAAEKAPEPERDYVRALARRYSNDPKTDRAQLARAYKDAMGELAQKYPDDLDAATLYAESAMNLRPWKLWGQDGKPAEGTEDILALLEDILRRDPNHPGANHYYVHAIEASPYPERGLTSAGRLAALVPGAGHLVHMSAHIYMRVARARAYLATGEAEKAGQERKEFLAVKKALPVDLMFSQWNTARGVLGIAEAVLGARFALAENDRPTAIKLLKQAVQAEDALAYGEPPDWIMPVRETLGAVLLLGGDAKEAEQVFRAGLANTGAAAAACSACGQASTLRKRIMPFALSINSFGRRGRTPTSRTCALTISDTWSRRCNPLNSLGPSRPACRPVRLHRSFEVPSQCRSLVSAFGRCRYLWRPVTRVPPAEPSGTSRPTAGSGNKLHHAGVGPCR
jgi:tetratricopeptide (TPR) repeat protein